MATTLLSFPAPDRTAPPIYPTVVLDLTWYQSVKVSRMSVIRRNHSVPLMYRGHWTGWFRRCCAEEDPR